MRSTNAFTLIELLIVVGIIAILAAIAVPNFLEAQTRAKVSKARSDLRTAATALEAYRVDWGDFPPSRGALMETDPVHAFDGYGRRCRAGFRTLSLRLSTPTAYLTHASIEDPFKRSASEGSWPYHSGNPADVGLGYHNVYEIALVDMEDGWYPDDYHSDYGHWRVFSIGPDREYNGFGHADRRWLYDPTNGTLSGGQIIRTQFDEEGEHLAIPDPESSPL
jgi:prepilin-type N-terminal cleavage/methylation domain-containing protein